MRKILCVVVFSLMWAGTAAPSHAQEAFFVVGAGQEACALFSQEVEAGAVINGEETSGGFLDAFVCGISFNEVWSDTGPEGGQGGCAAVTFFPFSEEEPFMDDFGCGELTVEVDPLLQTASIEGTLESFLFVSPDSFEDSTITLDVSWTATGVPGAGAGEFAEFFTVPAFADAGAGAVLYTPADADGSITSAALGGPEGPAVDAIIDEGVGLFIAVGVGL